MGYNIFSKIQFKFDFFCHHVCFSSLVGNFLFSQKKETFQKRFLKWTFGSKLAYEKHLIKFHHSQVSLLFEIRTLFLLLDFLEIKYLIDPYKHVGFQATNTTSKRVVPNPLKLINIPHLQKNLFFVRAANSSNYLYRHGIINLKEPTNKSSDKKFLLNPLLWNLGAAIIFVAIAASADLCSILSQMFTSIQALFL